MSDGDTNKTIYLTPFRIAPTVEKAEKTKKCRVITETTRWTKYISSDQQTQQFDILYNDVFENTGEEDTRKIECLKSLLQQKLNGYKLQDQRKNRFVLEEFVDIPYVLQKLKDCAFHCFYCKTPVQIWYIMSREPEQWTLERIDNTKGHNKNNVEIACLSCNLKRRCMYHERFRFTKQIQFIKS